MKSGCGVSMKKRALITGVEGQDGYYLARLLARKGYEVFGVVRKKARRSLSGSEEAPAYERIYADMMEFSSLCSCIREIRPDEIYNLAGLSEVPLSWKQPIFTAHVNALGVLRILEAMRLCAPEARFLQSSTSEIFAPSAQPLHEGSAMATRNPYGTAKLYGHWITTNYRESYGLFACAAILFNHESPRRGIEFVTRKISAAAVRIYLGRQEVLELGNLDAVRDWGSAEDYVRAMWLMLQQERPEDFVVATGEPHTVREFASAAFHALGIDLAWEGEGFAETARDQRTGEVLIRVNPALYRFPKEDAIVGNPAKAARKLSFIPTHSFQSLVDEIVKSDLTALTEGERG